MILLSVCVCLLVIFVSLLISVLCKVIYQQNRTISILCLIVIYNCTYIFSRPKDQVFYCYSLCVGVFMCWFLIDSLMKQQIRNSLGTKQKRSISAFCRAPSSTQKCRREICCNLHSLDLLPLSVFDFVSHFMILRCDNKPL